MTDLESMLREGLDEVARVVPVPEDAWAAYRSRRKPRRVRRRATLAVSVAGIAAATAGIVIGAIALSSGSAGSGSTVATTGRTVSLVPTRHISAQQLRASANVLARRLAADNLPDRVRVVTEGTPHLAVTAPATSLSAVAAVASTRGVLRFRQALSFGAGTPSAGSAGSPATSLAFSPNLTPAFEHSYTAWNCTKQRNPSRGDDPAGDYLIACSTDGTQKYLLAPAAVDGSEVSSASANLNTNAGTNWVVDLTFDRTGAREWRQVTARAAAVNNAAPADPSCGPPKGCNTLAIVFDGVVQSAPYISQPGGIAGGRAEISGVGGRQGADRLSAVIKSGALPTTFRVAR